MQGIWKLFLSTMLGLLTLLGLSGSLHAEQFVRIGTGGPAGTYYALGSAIAQRVTFPGKLIVTSQASYGSVANLDGIAHGAMESGFAQAELASWAYKGTGIFEGKPNTDLRLITQLYPESIHVVVRKNTGIKSIADLKGKRVGLDEVGSGTLISARRVLAAYGLKETDLQAAFIKAPLASEKIKEGTLDAFFFVGGAPVQLIAELATHTSIALLPIEGAPAQILRASSSFWSPKIITASTYKNVEAVSTLSVLAQWVCSAKVSPETVYQLTKALYSENTPKALQEAHAQAQWLTLQHAMKDAAIPIHSGAERFYREAGVWK